MADIQIEIEIDGKKTTANIKREAVKAGVSAGEESGKEFSKRFQQSSENGLKALRSGFTAALAGVKIAAVAAGAAVAGLAGAAVVSSKQQDAINDLEASLKRIGEFSAQTSKDIQDFASSLQAVTIVGDETILQQIALAQSFGATAEQSKQLVAAATDLAAAQGISSDQAVRQLGQTFGGLSGRLGLVIPQLKELTAEQLRAGGAIDIVASKFQGFASAQAKTFSGTIIQFKNLFGDLIEAIGSVVTGSTELQAVFIAIGQSIANATGSINGVSDSLGERLGKAAQSAAISVATLFQFFSQGFDLLAQNQGFQFIAQSISRATTEVNILGTAFRILVKTVQVTVASLETGFLAIITGITKVGSLIGVVSEGAASAVSDAFQKSANDTSDAFDSLFSQDTISKAQTFSESLRDTFEQVTGQIFDEETGEGPFARIFEPFSEENLQRITESLQNVNSSVVSAVSGAASVVTEEAKKINQAINNSLVNGVSTAFAFLGKSLAGAGGGFKAFLGIVLNALGDLAISIGTTVIGAALAIDGLKKSIVGTPFIAIALGGALIAAGAALKTFSASIGGGAGGAAPVSNGGDSFVSSPNRPLNNEFNEVREEERQQARTAQVIINGDVFDSQETGRRIVDLLNDAFEGEAAALTDARFA